MSTVLKLQFLFEEQSQSFFAGLITGGFVFFTLLSITVVWFLKNPLLRMLLTFTLLQTLLVAYEFRIGQFGEFDLYKLLVTIVLTNLFQMYLVEIKKRAGITPHSFENNHALIYFTIVMILILGMINGKTISEPFSKSIFIVYLSIWLYFGFQSMRIIKQVRWFYKISNFLLWFVSWVVFISMILPYDFWAESSPKMVAPYIYLGWLIVSFIAALSLIHQVVQLNAENIALESEQLQLKNKLGYVQLETSENERKRIVGEIHNDVLNRIDMLSMTANESKLDQNNININLTNSLNVLRKYTYKLYPPHIDVLQLSDIFSREAENWKEYGIEISVEFDPSWNQLAIDAKLPVFRFVESITSEMVKSEKLVKGEWRFINENSQFLLHLNYNGDFNNFQLNPNSYLIYKDILNAEFSDKGKNDCLTVTLMLKHLQ